MTFKGAMSQSARLPSSAYFSFWIRNPKSKRNEVEEIFINFLFSYWLFVAGTIISMIILIKIFLIN